MADVVRDFLAAGLVGLERVASTPLDPLGYGVDLVCVDDLTARMLETDPMTTAGLSQDAYHRLITRRGSLPDDEDYGLDIIGLLSAPLTAAQIQALPNRISSELLKDDRLVNAEVTTSYAYATKTMTIKLLLEPANASAAPFDLIITVVDGTAHLEALAS